jgi:hypothetical protein
LTIAIAVKVSEGLVLAADSALVVEGEVVVEGQPPQRGVVQVYSHATKVTPIREWPVGVINWGVGQIGSRTIESLVREYANGLGDKQNLDVKSLADGLHGFIDERYRRAFGNQTPVLGLQVAGYSPGEFFPMQYLVTFPPHPDGSVIDVRPDQPDGTPGFGANWYGMTDAICRLYFGVAPDAMGVLFPDGPPTGLEERLRLLHYPIIFEAMPLQDAIDFAAWLAEVTIGRFRFVVGPATVVGPVDIAVITRHDGFRWVRHKEPRVSSYYPAVN